MKKRAFLVWSLCALCGMATAQTVTVADVEALPGETVQFSLNLSGGKADTYTALSFGVQFPASGFATTGAYQVSGAWSGVMAVVGSVDETGLATTGFASASTITGANVENLVSVSFKVDESVAVGTYDVMLTDILFEYNIADKDWASDVTFHVNIIDAVVLDENATTLPEKADGVNVRVKRTINASEWSTICLPFAMSEAQVKEAFGSDVQIGDFTGWSSEEDGGAIVGISVQFTAATAIEANHPYIIKVSAPVTEFAVDNVDIDADDEPAVQVGKKSAERGWFYGTYTKTTVPEENLFLSDNKFWYSAGNTQTKGLRGYFEFRDVLDAYYDATEARISITFGDGETTGIDGVEDGRLKKENDATGNQSSILNSQSSILYNLNGQRVTMPGKGIYVVKGKKVKK